MRIVLLSGGSGKRLWPLANNTRSKQFLPLLDNGCGVRESMLQRVMRQISESGLSESVTIATNSLQKDIIINQLGDDIDMVTEPERRDTFPAIALAACHFKLELGLDDDETVAVMPCDPYTELSYFNVISEMAAAVDSNAAQLVLMGIKPSYPSTKFGYIVPEKNEGTRVLKVRMFTEKPYRERASELLAMGAFWNGGVFAFKLGYIMSIVRRYVDEDSFDKVVARYSDFPKISFDYEVAEKAQSVAVIPFDGSWKDLGTFNSFTKAIAERNIGNSFQGPETENVHVINELGTPIFVDGIKDAVVAACPDGILVCGKPQTENIKQYVEGFTQRPMYEERRWGTYKVIDSQNYSDGFKSLTKTITLLSGRNISYQLHHHRSEEWIFVDGKGILMLDGEVTNVSRGDVVHIEPEQKHAVKALTDLTFIEVQSGDVLVEEDIVRLNLEWPE